MDDNKIVELYWERREEAIKETALNTVGYAHTLLRIFF